MSHDGVYARYVCGHGIGRSSIVYYGRRICALEVESDFPRTTQFQLSFLFSAARRGSLRYRVPALLSVSSSGPKLSVVSKTGASLVSQYCSVCFVDRVVLRWRCCCALALFIGFYFPVASVCCLAFHRFRSLVRRIMLQVTEGLTKLWSEPVTGERTS
jgi:hypothetical protein